MNDILILFLRHVGANIRRRKKQLKAVLNYTKHSKTENSTPKRNKKFDKVL